MLRSSLTHWLPKTHQKLVNMHTGIYSYFSSKEVVELGLFEAVRCIVS